MSIAKIIEGRDQRIISCTAEESVQDAAGKLAEYRIGCLPVMDGGDVVGIFSERDLAYCVAREGAATLRRPVGEVMTEPAITVEPDMEALDALSLMTRRRIRHLPVIDNGKFIAFISIGDVVKFRIELIQAEADQMREYITQA